MRISLPERLDDGIVALRPAAMVIVQRVDEHLAPERVRARVGDGQLDEPPVFAGAGLLAVIDAETRCPHRPGTCRLNRQALCQAGPGCSGDDPGYVTIAGAS